MFNPRYAITNKLLENIKRITVLIAQLNSKRLPRVVLHAMEKEARELSAHTSTSIEGNPLPLAEVKRTHSIFSASRTTTTQIWAGISKKSGSEIITTT